MEDFVSTVLGREAISDVPPRQARWRALTMLSPSDPAQFRCVQQLGRHEYKGVVMT
jgi:hypothetical protein